jgi:hypothetical protein
MNLSGLYLLLLLQFMLLWALSPQLLTRRGLLTCPRLGAQSPRLALLECRFCHLPHLRLRFALALWLSVRLARCITFALSLALRLPLLLAL